MRRHVRVVAMVLVGALGMGAALALSAGADDVRACVSKSGDVRPAGPTARCTAGSAAITISGNAFKPGARGTITINGVPFRRSRRGRTITINGTAFKTGTLPRTLTINGNTFRTGTLPNSLTINGNSFRTGTLPNSLTINGNSFRSSGNTLTINGTTFRAGAAAQQGPPGPQGPAGAIAPGKAPAEVAGPIAVAAGATGTLVTLDFTGSQSHRIELAGGFDVHCEPCPQAVTPEWELRLSGAATPAVRRSIVSLGDAQTAGASVSEVLVTPAVCAPCSYVLSLAVPGGSAGGTRTVSATGIRLGLIDLGPVAP